MGRKYSQLCVVSRLMDTELHGAFSLLKCRAQGVGVQGVGSFRSFSAQSNSTIKITPWQYCLTCGLDFPSCCTCVLRKIRQIWTDLSFTASGAYLLSCVFSTFESNIPNDSAVCFIGSSQESLKMSWVGSGRFGSEGVRNVTGPVWSIPVNKFSNLAGWVGSGQEVLKSHRSGRVGS